MPTSCRRQSHPNSENSLARYIPDRNDIVCRGNLKTSSGVAANLVMTMDWTQRKVKKQARAEAGVLEDVLQRLLPLIGAEILFAK